LIELKEGKEWTDVVGPQCKIPPLRTVNNHRRDHKRRCKSDRQQCVNTENDTN